ncbi:MAG: hypothetical protein QOH72_1613 [Solirubrobacteraceae bacterium]|jgi:hypothetical protein|nr:hypothetical protein [Solirubrobacteraceae bacterium]
MRLRPSTWGKLCLGVLVIGGTLVGLWAAFRPSIDPTVAVKPPPEPPALHNARADVILNRAGSASQSRAAIACNGADRRATGFWARDPGGACDALASTRGALLAGPGCARPRRRYDRMRVVGSFAGRRFVHRAQRGPCPDVQGWLAVNALSLPVLEPEREATDANG